MDWQCTICGEDSSSLLNIKGDKLCNKCRYLLIGDLNIHGTERIIDTHDGICIWIKKDNSIDCAWNNDAALPKEYLKGKRPIDVIKDIREHKLIGVPLKLCTKCGKEVDDWAGSHFAGYFCTVCWEAYKKANSRKCGICGEPMYKCCC